jgi:hypothetical protein
MLLDDLGVEMEGPAGADRHDDGDGLALVEIGDLVRDRRGGGKHGGRKRGKRCSRKHDVFSLMRRRYGLARRLCFSNED